MQEGAAVRYVVDGGIAATVFISLGRWWDTLTHITRGHWLLAPAHLVMIAATALFTMCGGANMATASFTSVRSEADLIAACAVIPSTPSSAH
jgi:hypothetical protein